MIRLRHHVVPFLVFTLLAATRVASAQDLLPPAPNDESVRQAMDQGTAYLLTTQREDGGWEAFGRTHPAVTALAVNALAHQPGVGPAHPSVRRGLAFMLKFVQEDGGIYVPDEGLRNYHTSVALSALAAVNDPANARTVQRAQQFLKTVQWDEGEDHEPSSAWYGGQGYGKSKRPDLSNTQMMLEALKDSGLPPDDPAYKKAMAFVSRCQMLSASNDQPFARGAADGGFVYTPANEGESKAGTVVVDGKESLRSYGSMTYAGFKSMLYAHVDRDDPRVKGALEWIRRHYTLDSNPNMPDKQSKEGLYYYYHVFARAMDAWGEDILVDSRGRAHRWREELCAKLIALQNPDGSWFNPADRWFEGEPHLVTAYALRSMQVAKRK